MLLVVTRNQRRGAELSACTLATQLGARGFDVEVVGLAHAGGEPALPLETLGATPLAVSTLRRLRGRMAAADVVVACGSRTLPATVLASWGATCSIVYQNIGDPMFWAGTRLRRARVRAFLRRTAAVAALTPQSAGVLESHFGVPGGRITVIRNARSSSTFRPVDRERKAAARRLFDLPENGPLVAAVGALSPEKRVDVAVDATALLRSSARLVVAGDGELREELGRRAEGLAGSRVTFLGQVDELPQLLQAMDAVVLTSESEGVPGVLIEAGLSGLPVVATDVGYVRDVVVPGATGLLVPPGDHVATARALDQALADAPSLGAAARQRCVSLFDLGRASDDWAGLIESVRAEGEACRDSGRT